MVKIPRAESTSNYSYAEKPNINVSYGTDVGRAMQNLGSSIGQLGNAFGAMEAKAQAEADEQQSYQNKLALMDLDNDLKHTYLKLQTDYQNGVINDDQYKSQWGEYYGSRTGRFYQEHPPVNARQQFQYDSRIKSWGSSYSIDQEQKIITQRRKRSFTGAQERITKEFGVLAQSPDDATFAKNWQSSWAGVGGMIDELPLDMDSKTRLRKHAATSAYNALIARGSTEENAAKTYPFAEGWLKKWKDTVLGGQKEGGPGGAGGPQGPMQLGSPEGATGPTLTSAQRSRLKGVQSPVVTRFERLQQLVGKELPVNSGYRDPNHNRRVGGAKKSQHVHGNAIDINVRGLSREQRVDLIEKASALGFTGIGVYNNAIHVDLGGRRAWGPSYGRASVPSWARTAINRHLQNTYSGMNQFAGSTISQSVPRGQLISMIKGFEGFNPNAYDDYGQISVGYGTRAKSSNEKITQAEAEKRLDAEVSKAERLVDRFSKDLPPGIRLALTSLTYNSGSKWMQSGLGKAIKAGDYARARELFLQYNKAGGKTLPGLVKRRQQEVAALWDGNGGGGGNFASAPPELMALGGPVGMVGSSGPTPPLPTANIMPPLPGQAPDEDPSRLGDFAILPDPEEMTQDEMRKLYESVERPNRDILETLPYVIDPDNPPSFKDSIKTLPYVIDPNNPPQNMMVPMGGPGGVMSSDGPEGTPPLPVQAQRQELNPADLAKAIRVAPSSINTEFAKILIDKLPALRAAHEKVLDKARRAERLRGILTGVVPFDKFDNEQTKDVDKFFLENQLPGLDNRTLQQALLLGDMRAIEPTVQAIKRLNYVPESIGSVLRTMSQSVPSESNPNALEKRAMAYEIVASAMRPNRDAFDGRGYKDLVEEATLYESMVMRGYDPKEALSRIQETKTDEWEKKKESAARKLQGQTGLMAKIDPEFVLGKATEQWWSPTMNEAQKGVMTEEYREEFEYYFIKFGDEEAAHQHATDVIRNIWGPTGITRTRKEWSASEELSKLRYEGRMMRYPPEKSYKSIGGSHNYLHDDLKTSVNQFVNREWQRQAQIAARLRGEDASKIQKKTIQIDDIDDEIVSIAALNPKRAGEQIAAGGREHYPQYLVTIRNPYEGGSPPLLSFVWGLSAADIAQAEAKYAAALQNKRNDLMREQQKTDKMTEREQFKKGVEDWTTVSPPHEWVPEGWRKGAEELFFGKDR